MNQRPAGPRGAPPLEAPIPRVAEVAPEGVLQPAPAAASLRGRSYLALLLFVPGGLILAFGVGIAWVGLALCWPGLRSLAGALRSGESSPQSDGASREPGPRVWLGQGGTC